MPGPEVCHKLIMKNLSSSTKWLLFDGKNYWYLKDLAWRVYSTSRAWAHRGR